MTKKKRRGAGSRREKRLLTILCVALSVILVALVAYTAGWYANRRRILRDAERYRQLYHVDATDAPASDATPSPSPEPTPTPEAASEPDENTRVYALPTAPPVMKSFDDLLRVNPDTVGFLQIEDMLSLPVVQRCNDNEYYLDHSFEGAPASEGTLFLDGANLLVPEDDCLIVYGHNMKNNTMFGRLDDYDQLDFLQKHPIVRFDTLYEKRAYVPFAAFTASVLPSNGRYFDVRQFIFDEDGFELFTLRLQSRSIYNIPLDVRYGDRLLLLVTCDYTADGGRFLLALRQLRPDEPEDAMLAVMRQAKWK